MRITASIKVVMLTQPLKSGKHAIHLRVTHNRVSRYQSLGLSCKPEQWDSIASKFRKSYPQHKEDNAFLVAIEARAQRFLRTWALEGTPFDFNNFSANMWQYSADSQIKVCDCLKQLIQSLQKENKFSLESQAKACLTALKSFDSKARLKDISPEWIEQFDAYMDKVGKSFATRKVYMVALKKVCKSAAKSGAMPNDWQPFANATLSPRTQKPIKRALDIETIWQIERAEVTSNVVALHRDIFMLSFYLRGMNLTDLVHVKYTDIVGGRLKYSRSKTEAKFNLPINNQAKEIIERMRSGPYILPLRNRRTRLTERQLHDAIIKYGNAIAMSLRRIAEAEGIETERPLSMYFARHSYATAAKRAGISTELISELMGHSDLKTTQMYLSSFDNRILDDADKIIFEKK